MAAATTITTTASPSRWTRPYPFASTRSAVPSPAPSSKPSRSPATAASGSLSPLALLPFSSSAAAFPLLLALLLGSLLDLLLVGLVKHLVCRPRPAYNKGMGLAFAVDHWSFPSGHSSRVFFIASSLRLSHASLRQLVAGRRWIGAHYGGDTAELLLRLVFVWSVSTSASRVLLGRHFVLDVVAGSCLGVLEAFIAFYFFHFYRF